MPNLSFLVFFRPGCLRLGVHMDAGVESHCPIVVEKMPLISITHCKQCNFIMESKCPIVEHACLGQRLPQGEWKVYQTMP